MSKLRADPRYFTQEVTGERQLVAAFLLRAWADLDHPNRFVVNDAYYWIIEAKKKTFEPWGFAWACNVMGVCVEETRKLMLGYPFYQRVLKLAPDRYKKDDCAID